MATDLEAAAPSTAKSGAGPVVLGIGLTGVGSVVSYLAHEIVQPVGPLTWAVFLGMVVANVGRLPAPVHAGASLVTKRALRVGVVLLGLSLPVSAILALGAPVIALVVVTLTSTLVATNLLGQRMGLGSPRSLLIATGFAICGASAIAGMEENAEADEEDVAVAVAMVTICGSVAMVVLPLLQSPLGLSDVEYGTWVGASVHEVGQVVAAAGPAGATAVGVAVVVKLTRVLLLAPVVAGVGVQRRRRAGDEQAHRAAGLPPVVPAFVLGFVACVGMRSVGLVPVAALPAIATMQTLVLSAALFGMGTAVRIPSLLNSCARPLVLAAISTLLVTTVSLVGVVTLV